MKKVVRYFKGVGREAKRIKWPTREVLTSSIIVVICITVFAGLFLALEDYAAGVLLEQLRKAFELIK